jgi:hypothetical protein
MISDNVPGPSSDAIRTARPSLRVTTPLQQSHVVTELRAEQDLVADLDILQLGHDPVRAVDVGPDQVFEEVVAVEPASSLT